MSRFWANASLLLFLMICALAWAACDMRDPDTAVARTPDEGTATSTTSSVEEELVDPPADQRGRLDTRSASLEMRRGLALPPAAVPEIPLAEADRQLARLLTADIVDRRQLVQFQMDIAELPQAERFALSAALVRAMNQDRIRIRE